MKACKPVIFIKFTQRCKCEQSIKSEQRLFGVVRMIKCLSANRIVCIANVIKLLDLNMFTHGANVRKTTTSTKFSRGRKCDQTLNSRKFAWSQIGAANMVKIQVLNKFARAAHLIKLIFLYRFLLR